MTTTYKEPGRARKPCPGNCGLYIHVRSKTCDSCVGKVEITEPTKPQKQKSKTKSEKTNTTKQPKRQQNRILTPAGKCPIKPYGNLETPEDIENWCNALLKNNPTYSADALVYFGKEFIDVNNETDKFQNFEKTVRGAFA